MTTQKRQGRHAGRPGCLLAAITSCTRRQAVTRLHGQSKADAAPRRCATRMQCTRSSMSSSSGGTGTARNTPVRRFFRLSNTITRPDRSICRGGQGEGLGNPASGGMQHAAEGAHLARRPGGGGHEGAAFILGEIQPPPVGVEQLHTGVTGPPLGGAIDTFHRNSVSRQPRQGQRNGDKPPQSAVGRADRARFQSTVLATAIRRAKPAQHQLVVPGDDVRARHGAELLRLLECRRSA